MAIRRKQWIYWLLVYSLLASLLPPAQPTWAQEPPTGDPDAAPSQELYLPLIQNNSDQTDVATGFGFAVDPDAGSTLAQGRLDDVADSEQATDTSSADVENSTEPRRLNPLTELALASFQPRFEADNRFVIQASFTNITPNRLFLQPFTFRTSQLTHNIVSSTEPTLTPQDLGGDGILSPGETTAVLTFAVEHKRKPFLYVVDLVCLLEYRLPKQNRISVHFLGYTRTVAKISCQWGCRTVMPLTKACR